MELTFLLFSQLTGCGRVLIDIGWLLVEVL